MKKKFSFILLIIYFQIIAVSQTVLQEYHLGIVNLNTRQYEDAVKHFSYVLEKEPGNVNALLYRGQAYIELHEFENALKDLEEADKKKSNIASYSIAQVYSLKNEPEKAVEYLELHLKSRYKLPESQIRLDEKFNRIKNTEAWLNLWKNQWYSKKELIQEEIKYLNKNKDFFEALDLADKQLKKYKKDYEMYALRAETYSALDNPKAAIVNYNKAINLNKRIPGYYIQRGKAYLDLGKEKNALIDFEKALKLSDDHIDLYLYKARVMNEMGKFSHALDEVMKYLELLPDDQEALLLCGKTFFNNSQFKESIFYLSKLIDADPSKATYFILRANSYFSDKQYRMAYDDYSMALDLDPKNPIAYLQRGNALLRNGQYSRACSDWEKADQMGSLEAKKNIMQFCE